MTHRNFGPIRFAPVGPPSSASAGATGRDSVAPARNQPARSALGGIKQPTVRHGAGGTRANLISFPPLPRGSLADPGSSSLKSRDMSDAARDRVAMAFFLGVLCGICALALFAWGVVLSFVG